MIDNNNKDVFIELEKEASILAKIPKVKTSVLPTHYFEDVEEQILKQLSFISIINEPKIDSLYFEQVEEKILSSLSNDVAKVVPFYQRNIVKYLAAASIVCILSFISYSLYSDYNQDSENIISSNISETDYYHFIEQNIEDVDIQKLIDQELIVESDLTFVSYLESDLFEANDELFSESEINFY